MKHTQAPLKARVSQQDAAALYDRLAGLYDVWGHLTERHARNRAIGIADVRPGDHVLEVAVGTGLAFEHLVRVNPSGRNVGIDLSPGMLRRATRRLGKARLENFELSVGSAMAIQEKADSFDVLMNNYMFDLLDEQDWTKALAEFHRVLKHDGRLVLVNMTYGEGLGSGIYRRLYELSPQLMGGCRGVQMSDALQRSGFHVHLREYHQQLLFPSEVILAWKSHAPSNILIRNIAPDRSSRSTWSR